MTKNKKDFISRCVAQLNDSGEFDSDEQRAAVCNRQWKDSKNMSKANILIPKETESKVNFMARCMNDESMSVAFDSNQRQTQCSIIWNEYRVNDDGNMVLDLSLYGEVGEEITAENIRAFLDEAGGKDVSIELYSGGGNLFEGSAIYAMLRKYKGNVEVRVLSIAASAAAYIAVAADRLVMEEGAFLMIHNAWTMAAGNSDQLREQADLMDRQQAGMVQAFVDKSGASAEQVKTWMDAETWFSAQEALDAGFADDMFEADEQTLSIAAMVYEVPKALADKYNFKNVPDSVTLAEKSLKQELANHKSKRNATMDNKILLQLGIQDTNASADAVVAKISSLQDSVTELQGKLEGAETEVNDLKADNEIKSSKISELEKDVQMHALTDVVTSVLDEVGGKLAKESQEALERRAQRYLNEENEDAKADMKSDMILFAKSNVIETGKSSELEGKNSKASKEVLNGEPVPEQIQFEAQVQAKMDEILEENPDKTFAKAMDEAKTFVKAQRA